MPFRLDTGRAVLGTLPSATRSPSCPPAARSSHTFDSTVEGKVLPNLKTAGCRQCSRRLAIPRRSTTLTAGAPGQGRQMNENSVNSLKSHSQQRCGTPKVWQSVSESWDQRWEMPDRTWSWTPGDQEHRAGRTLPHFLSDKRLSHLLALPPLIIQNTHRSSYRLSPLQKRHFTAKKYCAVARLRSEYLEGKRA
ncbi:hypothetical protein BDP55DRAFT_629241 [Colletotrichum godetiae]|uniref:Uncharacterized protein n=1 Tax=Colletotrichum godetiae TaxID=1209918 RepID=A0AAJ0AW98_9PEZI|nr:uncharacterized protein BDP55DRAFT_629241 [Colletotrichum godetiae]KAK1689284.1 hypothetical protein BDP55DRAFT_629241 [Colletotrichum godetiae]